MQQESYKTSQIFVPSVSKRFTMKIFKGFEPSFKIVNHNDDVEMCEQAIPFGIIDAWKINNAYKQLLEELEIHKFDNAQIVSIFEERIKQQKDEQKVFVNIYEDLANTNDSIQIDQPILTNLYQDVIFLWRTTHLSIPSIAFKAGC